MTPEESSALFDAATTARTTAIAMRKAARHLYHATEAVLTPETSDEALINLSVELAAAIGRLEVHREFACEALDMIADTMTALGIPLPQAASKGSN